MTVCTPGILKPAPRASPLCNTGNTVKVPALERPQVDVSQPGFPTAVLEQRRGVLKECFAYGRLGSSRQPSWCVRLGGPASETQCLPIVDSTWLVALGWAGKDRFACCIFSCPPVFVSVSGVERSGLRVQTLPHTPSSELVWPGGLTFAPQCSGWGK